MPLSRVQLEKKYNVHIDRCSADFSGQKFYCIHNHDWSECISDTTDRLQDAEEAIIKYLNEVKDNG